MDQEILKELKRITRLLAVSLLKDKSTLTDRVEALNFYGFSSIEIAHILGEKPNKIRATLSNIKKKTQK